VRRHVRQRIARDVLTWTPRALLLLSFAVFLALGILPRSGAYRTVTALSASMTPTFRPGDMLVLRPEPLSSVRAGQVISFSIPTGDRRVETHRIVKVLRGGSDPVVWTRGDANNTRDPWTAELHGSQAWRLTAIVPYAGWPLLWLREPPVRLALVVVAPALLLLLGLFAIWRPARRTAGGPAPAFVGDWGLEDHDVVVA
jgi:signal peptidase I